MINSLIKKLFSKSESDLSTYLPQNEQITFILMFKDLKVGELSCLEGKWEFKYSDEFKKKADVLKPIIGFKDLDKIYNSDTLWPFFRLRIPGLKQPMIREIIEKEHLDKNNEVELLKRFGEKTIANPYELVTE